MLVAFVKGVLGIKGVVAGTSSIFLGSGYLVWGSLFMWFFVIAILIKAGLSAFKGTEAEQMDPAENVKNIFQQKQKQEQQRQRAIEKANFQPDRIKK